MYDVMLKKETEAAIEAMQPEVLDLIRALCAIPAPSHHEERRAAFIRDWFAARGMQAEIDEALNVLCPMGLDEHEEMVVIMAHTDTVFPDMEPMPFYEKEGKMYCPGVGDDTTNVAAMMLLADYFHKHAKPNCGVLFVANSCEEGLGNLKGCKAIMKAYGQRVKAFLSLDCGYEEVCAKAVGSARYRITARTIGGHSFSDFGNANAIAVLAGLVTDLYAQNVPVLSGTKTTYNVGMISGGTSVNTIAQQAEMLYEYRSDNAQCMDSMKAQFDAIIAKHSAQQARIEVELIGERPCGRGVDEAVQAELERACCAAIRRYTAFDLVVACASTDCNIPLSMGIPSACFGVYLGGGAHTREEWVDMASILPGMKAAACVMMNWFE